LLHYVAANGVEACRQKTPPNAVEIARALLEAGAEPDALADMYGAKCTTMEMLVSSDHPAQAGLQVPLAETLLAFGAAVDGRGNGKWGGPINTALTFGMSDAAKALARHGAAIDLPAAAGLGDAARAASLLSASNAEARRRALSLAAQHGHAEIVQLLLDAGESPDRYNPQSNHGHTTPAPGGARRSFAGGAAHDRARRAARCLRHHLAGHAARLGAARRWQGASRDGRAVALGRGARMKRPFRG
jgi:hypothetical protein